MARSVGAGTHGYFRTGGSPAVSSRCRPPPPLPWLCGNAFFARPRSKADITDYSNSVYRVKRREHVSSLFCGDRKMLRLVGIVSLLLLQQALAQNMTLSVDQVVGTWRLVTASALSGNIRNDAPFGPAPSGLITYTSDGRVMAIICHSGRKPLVTGDRISASTDERAEAFATSFSYAGRYSVLGNKISHHVEIASVQNWVN